MKIAHFADIHWRGLTRHDEYTNAFQLAFEELRKIRPDIIFLGGDIFHTKTQNITPEVIDRLVWMFRGFANIAPTHIILGNHDGNLTNEDRQDAISPIIEAINDKNLFLYKKSGIYRIGTIFTPQEEEMDGDFTAHIGTPVQLCVYSCFDKDNWNKVKPTSYVKSTFGGSYPDKNTVNIAAFHGSINGSKVDSDMAYGNGILEAEEEVTFFNGYDFVLLGDIHKRQFLSERLDKNNVKKPWIAYPGSTIQQNFGEDEVKGFLVWDIRAKDDWDVEFVEIKNLQPFVTLEWKGNVNATLETVKKERKDLASLTGLRIRVASDKVIVRTEVIQLNNHLKETYAIEGTVGIKDNTTTNLSTIDTNSVSIKKSSLRNDINALMQLYRDFLDANKGNYTLTEDQISKVKEIINGYIKKINAQESDQTRDVIWSVKGMEFNNTYRYGEGNSISFEKLEGIVGIFGPNRTGKSSIVGTMMYGLFNTTDRGPMKAAHIINKSKKYCDAKLLINVGGSDYLIKRETRRAEAKRATTVVDEEKTSTALSVMKIQNDGSTIDLTKENGDSRTDTDKVIRKLIGNAQDFLLTAFSNQGGINKFIDQGATERKSILNRFMDIEILEKIFKNANEDMTIINAKASRYPSGSWDKLIADAKMAIEQKQDALALLEEEIDGKRNDVDTLRLWVFQHENSAAAVDIGVLNGVQKTIQKLSKELETGMALYQKGISDIVKIEGLISMGSLRLEHTNIEDLRSKNEQFSLATEKMRELVNSHKEQNNTLQQQEKSVRKLALVPCGEQFPECHFIKDSHYDKTLIEGQKQLVQEILSQLAEIEATVKAFQQEKIADKIKDYEKLIRDLETAKTELKLQKSRLETVEMGNKQLKAKLEAAQQEEQELLGKVNLLESKEFDQKKVELHQAQQEFAALEKRKSSILVQIGADKNKLDQLRKDMKESQELTEEQKVYDSISAAFHKNGIPAMLLKTQLPAINMELAKILANVVDFKITLETDTNSNVMDVFIEDGSSRRIIELASGAEKMIASLALRVALINLSSLPKPDMLILDEGFGVLDEENIPKVLQLLVALKSYFKTILVITHVPEVKEIADRIIEIQNNGSESKVIC
jgi:DNA repair exonuclease SbcCD nuclease subunit/ABC-type Mn2+/Zn2+ transport system ATPase subunit